MSDHINQAFTGIHDVVTSSNYAQTIADSARTWIANLERIIKPPLSLDYSDDLCNSSFQAVRDISEALRHKDVVATSGSNIDRVMRLPVAVFVNLVHKKEDILAFITEMNTALTNNIFSPSYVESYVRCTAMLLETAGNHEYPDQVKQDMCLLILAAALPMLTHILTCNTFSLFDVSIMQNSFTIFMASIRLGCTNKQSTQEWTDELRRIFSKKNLASLYTHADACFFTVFHHQKTSTSNRILSAYYAENIERLVDFVYVNSHAIIHARRITDVLVFICNNYKSFLDATRPHVSKLLSTLLTVFRVNAHHLIEESGERAPYSQHDIERFIRHLLFCYPEMCSKMVLCINKTFNCQTDAPLSSVVASINAMICCNAVLLFKDRRQVLHTWVSTHLSQTIHHDSPIVQLATLRAVRAYLPRLNNLKVAYQFITEQIINRQLVGNSSLSPQIRKEIFSLLVELAKRKICNKVFQGNLRTIVKVILRSTEDEAERLLEIFYDVFVSTPTNIVMFMNECASAFLEVPDVPDHHVQRFFDVASDLVSNRPTNNPQCIMKLYAFLKVILQSQRAVYKEGGYNLLTALITYEGTPSIMTTKFAVEFIRTAGSQFYRHAQSLCCFFQHRRPSSTMVVYAMLKLTFSLRDYPRENFTSFFMWLSKTDISFSQEHSLDLIRYLKWLNPMTNSCLITILCSRIMSSASTLFIEQFISDVTKHWSQTEFLDKWLNDSVKRQVIFEVLRLTRCALSNALFYYQDQPEPHRLIQRCNEYLLKKIE